MKNSREIQRLQKTSYKEDWTWQVGVELQETMGVHSISTAFEGERDDGKLYADRLLEEILDANNTRKGYWRISNSPVLATTLTNKYLESIGYASFNKRYKQVH